MSTGELILILLNTGFRDFNRRGDVSLSKFFVYFNEFLEREILTNLK